MKKSDIKIGGEYAYATNYYGLRQRVKVLGEARIQQGWAYQKKFITGSRVQMLDPSTGQPVEGRIYEVANRTLREPWVDYAEREAALRKARLDGDRRTNAARRARAESLPKLLDALEVAGVEVVGTSLWADNQKVLPLLREFIPERLTDGPDDSPVTSRVTLTAPLAASIPNYIESGARFQVDAATLAMLANLR